MSECQRESLEKRSIAMDTAWTLRDATVDDMKRVHELVVELATFEREPMAVKESVEGMQDSLRDGVFRCIVAQEVGESRTVVGFALYYGRYSTWEGRCMYLEDIYVTLNWRGKGVGRALFLEVARRSARLNCARLQWQVLNWNESAIRFYQSLDSLLDPTWVNCKLDRERLQKLI
jgi:GNAT superfamily N-acetyltransferase